MDWRLFLVLAILAVPILVWWLSRPLHHHGVRFDDLDRFFASWVADLATGTVIVLRDDATHHFVQFVLNKDHEAPELDLGFPDAPWSRDFFENVRVAVEEAGFSTRIQGTDSKAVGRFLEATVRGGDEPLTAKAIRLTTTVLRAMGHDETTRLTVWAEGRVDADALAREAAKLREHRSPVVRAFGRRMKRRERH
jgi:hypothetical protein